MQRDEDIRHALNFLDRVIGFGQIDVHAGSDGGSGGGKIFIIAAKSRNNRPAAGSIDRHRLAAHRMTGEKSHRYRPDIGITVDFDDLIFI